MKVHLLTVGDEILIGQVVDTNSAWMARQLNLHGAGLTGITSVGDDLDAIQEALARALEHADAVLMTGGLGPTKDDITKKALATFFGVEMTFDQPTYDRIVRFFDRLGRPTTEAHHRQCYMPVNATLLRNRMGTAPGMWFEHQDKVVVSMPGVPYEMEALMTHEVIPRLQLKFRGRPIAHRTLLTVGEGESRIAARIEAFEETLPAHFKLAYLPNLGQVRLRLTATGDDEILLQQEVQRRMLDLEQLLSDVAFGHDDEQLEEVLGHMLRERNLTICTAESCTGGYLAHRITAISGSSDYFQGSVIAYSNDIKMKLLSVQSSTLEQYGAVSEPTVVEMVKGALLRLDTNLAIAISGIAGPGGGTPEKPVGTIWMAIGNEHLITTQLIRAGKDRLKNIQYATVHALNLIRRFLLEQYPPAGV